MQQEMKRLSNKTGSLAALMEGTQSRNAYEDITPSHPLSTHKSKAYKTHGQFSQLQT